MDLQAGGILGFQTRDVISDTINVFTGSLPGHGIHHVGIVSNHVGALGDGKTRRPLLYESTTSERPPCIFTGLRGAGVGARTIPDSIDFFKSRDTKIFYYGLRSPLYSHEEQRLDEWLQSKIGVPYNMDGALSAGGGLLYRSLSIALHGENLHSFFCSAMCMAALVYINRANTDNYDRWNPNKLVHYLVKVGICNPGVRIL